MLHGENQMGQSETNQESRDLLLLNKYGMHVRPAGLFAKVASRFNADVEVEKDGSIVSGKSIMALMTLEAVCGTILRVTASGPQFKDVLDELEALVARKFDIPDEQ
jgi:phosphocarrier protein